MHSLKYLIFCIQIVVVFPIWSQNDNDSIPFKKSVVALTDNCEVLYSENELTSCEMVVDSTYNINCHISVATIRWWVEETQGLFYIKILPELIFIGWRSNALRAKGYCGIIPISNLQSELIIEYLNSRKSKVLNRESKFKKSGRVRYLNYNKKFVSSYEPIINNNHFRFYEDSVKSIALRTDLLRIFADLNNAFQEKSDLQIDTNIVEERKLYFFKKNLSIANY